MFSYSTKRASFLDAVGVLSGSFCAVSFGLAAAGFVQSFVAELAGSHGSSDLAKGLIYTISAIIGLNAAYRIGKVEVNGAPKGLRLLLSAEDGQLQGEAGKAKKCKILGVVLSIAAGVTFGGFTYLGAASLLQLESTAAKGALSLFCVVSNFMGSGALFSYAWVNGLNQGTLWLKGLPTSSCSLMLQVLSVMLALFGLACTMMLGSLGLSASLMHSAVSSSDIIGWVIAAVGFCGEAPFIVNQGRTFIVNLTTEKPESQYATVHAEESMEQPQAKSGGLQHCLAPFSVFLYTVYTFCGTYVHAVGVFNIGVAARVVLGLGSAYLSLVTVAYAKNKPLSLSIAPRFFKSKVPEDVQLTQTDLKDTSQGVTQDGNRCG